MAITKEIFLFLAILLVTNKCLVIGSSSEIQPSATVVIASSSILLTGTADNNECNANFTAPSGRILSPHYPFSMVNNTECVWSIRLPAGLRILLNLELFSPGTQQNCSSMYLEIYDGGRTSPLIDKYCGEIFQESVISTGNEMFLRMVFKDTGTTVINGTSLSKDSSSVFRLSYKNSTQASDIVINVNRSGSLSSPLYPGNYPHNVNQTWTLRAPAGQQISLLFSKFLLESSTGCLSDYLEISDPLTPGKTSKYCGYRLGDWLLSKGETLVLTFKTNSKLSASGFLINYKAISLSCNETYTNDTGVLTYQEQVLSCFWKIEVPFGYEILLSFDRFLFGDSEDCIGTSLSIRDGLSETSPLIETFCSLHTGEKIKSSGNELYVSYEVKERHAEMGFEISYKTIESECQNVYLNDTTGWIASPNYPLTYNSNSNCSWLIDLDPQNIISLTFENMEIEFSINCTNDYVMIYDGPTSSSPVLGRFCGDLLESVVSTGSLVFVEFVSDSYLSRKGFQLSYSAINTSTACRLNKTTVLTDSSGTIYSTNFPELYPNNLDCSWLITSEPGYQIHVVFEYFEIEEDPLCETDYVVFHNDFNDSVSTTRIAKHCGFIRQWDMEPIISEAEVMFIRFHSNADRAKKGFAIKYEAKETGTPIPPPELIEEEAKQSVQFTISDTGMTQWEMQMYNPFQKAMATAANKYCELNSDPDCNLKDSVRLGSDTKEFKKKNVFLLEGYPQKINDNKDLLIAFYMEYPTGASHLKVVPYPVVLAILNMYQADIEQAIDTPILEVAPHMAEPEPLPQGDNTDAVIAIVVVMLVIILIAGLFIFWNFYWKTGKWNTKVKEMHSDGTNLIKEDKEISSVSMHFRRRTSSLRYVVTCDPCTPDMPRKQYPVVNYPPIREASLDIREPVRPKPTTE